jgi:hypothetical protein
MQGILDSIAAMPWYGWVGTATMVVVAVVAIAKSPGRKAAK